MEVILKLTARCNFNCEFCSSSNLQLLHLDDIPTELAEALVLLNPTSIIITGGDPLMSNPDIYFKLLRLGNWSLSFTTNLKDFYLNKSKWILLFSDSRVHVCTSFLYGDKRKWNQSMPYDETMFKKVMSFFYDNVGYMPTFISVIDNDNEKYAFEHLKLAKALRTKCKLNGLMPLGKSVEYYPMSKLLELWLDISDSEYSNYHDIDVCCNGGCNLNTKLLCESCIRAIAISSDGRLLYANCEDELIKGNFIPKDTCAPTLARQHLNAAECITTRCMFCKLYYVCNGCKQYRQLNKITPNHCQNMKKLEDKIIHSNIRIQP